MGDPTGTSNQAGTGTPADSGNLSDHGTLGIAGIGLIGGSIAAAVKARGRFSRVIGFGRSRERLDAARQAGLIDVCSTGDPADYRDVDLFVSCLPVDRIAESLREAASHMRPGTLLTDAGSVKQSICDSVGPEPAEGVTFLGSHPLAGSEKQGFSHADAHLFARRVCVLTPTGSESANAIASIDAFWRGLGSDTVTLSPAEHDRILARTSHLPHLLASALATLPEENDLRLAAGGFRDTTRIAGGDPDLWTAILTSNRTAVEEALTMFLSRCDAFRAALHAGDDAALRDLLTTAKSRRDLFGTLFHHGAP